MKRILTTLCALAIVVAGSVPALAVDTDANPGQSASYYPISVEEYTYGSLDEPRIEKVYQLSLSDDPSGIPTEDFVRGGRLYYLLDMTRKNEVGVDTKLHTESVTKPMKDKYIQTSESVTEGHPDKLCDTIADTVLDACLEHDPNAHVACEVLATAGKILVAGEITAKVLPDIPAIVARTVHETGYHADYEIEVITHDQSPNIAGAVDRRGIFSDQRGAGDQGIMYGYACSETDELLPMPVILAHRLTRLLTHARKTGTIRGLGPDGKAQVSVEYVLGLPRRVNSVVVSCQHSADKDVSKLRQEIMKFVIIPALQEIPMDEDTEILVNPSDRFVLGGFEADTGLTGRKLMVDTYGGLVPHGGGALSGKDGTKVDRSGAYMFPPLADPGDPAQDQAARDMCLRLVEACQQVNVYGPTRTKGMRAEIRLAEKLGIPIKADQKEKERTSPCRKRGWDR